MFSKEKIDNSERKSIALLENEKYVDIGYGNKLYYLYDGYSLKKIYNSSDWDNFELKELPKPQTGVIGRTIPQGNRININMLNLKKDLCIEFTEFSNKNMLIACIRKNNKLELSLPSGMYFTKYNYYDKWYGLSDLFSNGGKSVSNKQLSPFGSLNIGDNTTIYIGQDENNDDLSVLSLYEWKNAIEKFKEQ